MRALVATLVLVVLALAGCVELTASRVPDRLLEGSGGNGWEKNQTASQREPASASWGTSKSQTLAYEDRRSDEGYPGTLTVTTLRSLLRPSQDTVLEVARESIRKEAERKGVDVQGSPTTGTRQLTNGAQASWFVYDGSVSSSAFFQERNARVKIYGEVFQCAAQKTVVVTVGLAQITDVRSVGGVPLPSEQDHATWREIAADPRGSIEGIRGSDGLGHNVTC